jgi:hypothetical protein
MRNTFLAVAALATVLSTPGCATVTRGDKQRVQFQTDPPGAALVVDGQSFTTPAEVKLKRKPAHDILVSKEGYESIRFKLKAHWDAGGVGAVVLDAAVPGGSALFLIDTLVGADRKFSSIAIIKMLPATMPATQPITLYEYKGKLLEQPQYEAAVEHDRIFKTKKKNTSPTTHPSTQPSVT